MKSLFIGLGFIAVSSWPLLAVAKDAPKPPETAAIEHFVKTATWSGKLPAKTPGGPEIPTKGHMTCRWFAEGWWHECEIEDNMGTGANARQWLAHWVSGWEPGAKEYRGYIFDSEGTSSAMRGRREGEKLIYESISDVVMRGKPTRLRFTFDASDPKGTQFTAEKLVDGKWTLIEHELHVPTKQTASR